MVEWHSILLLLGVINVLDSIAYTIVSPSLIFYILSVGGSKEQYGLVMSSFSFFSIVGCLVYGAWIDRLGSKFRVPYIVCTLAGIAGGLYYFFASIVYEYYAGPVSSNAAVGMILVGRIVGGFGSSYASLGYSYLALTVPFDKQTKANCLFSLSRIFGMAIGSMVNWFLVGIDVEIQYFGLTTFHLTPLNSVGLLLAVSNVLILIVVISFLKDPSRTRKKEKPKVVINKYLDKLSNSAWKSICCIEIMLPICTKLIVNCNFQLNETALPPAANDALGWGTVELSVLKSISSALNSLLMLLIVMIADYIPDTILTIVGVSFSLFGGLGSYFGWIRDGRPWYFIVSVLVSSSGFPFTSGANRASFSKSIASKPQLENLKSTLQTILSTTNNLAGVMTPFLVAKFVVRSPEEVNTARDNREMTSWALVLPVLCALILVGLFVLWQREAEEKNSTKIEEQNSFNFISETPLVTEKQENAILSTHI